MRVLFYTEAYSIGGCDRFIVDLVGGLDRSRYEVAVAGVPCPERDSWMHERLPRDVPCRTVRIASLREPLPGRAWRALTGHDTGVVASNGEAEGKQSSISHPQPIETAVAALRFQQAMTNYLRLRRLIRKVRPDVVHINNGGYPGGESCRIAALAARAESVPGVVHHVHNMPYAPSWPVPVERALDGRIDRAVDRWLTSAQRTSDALSTVRGFARERIETVHYGIPVSPPTATPDGVREDLAIPDGSPVLAVVAAFEPRKGHATLLDALAMLRARGLEPYVLLVGTGSTQPDVERRGAELGLSRLRFLGWRNDVERILAASDALVLPSTANECLPYAILEAMRSTLPVVGTDVAGIPEQIDDGTTGRVVAPGEPALLAAAVHDVLADRDAARLMGARGRHRLERLFSLGLMVDRITALWGDVAGRGRWRR